MLVENANSIYANSQAHIHSRAMRRLEVSAIDHHQGTKFPHLVIYPVREVAAGSRMAIKNITMIRGSQGSTSLSGWMTNSAPVTASKMRNAIQ